MFTHLSSTSSCSIPSHALHLANSNCWQSFLLADRTLAWLNHLIQYLRIISIHLHPLKEAIISVEIWRWGLFLQWSKPELFHSCCNYDLSDELHNDRMEFRSTRDNEKAEDGSDLEWCSLHIVHIPGKHNNRSWKLPGKAPQVTSHVALHNSTPSTWITGSKWHLRLFIATHGPHRWSSQRSGSA